MNVVVESLNVRMGSDVLIAGSGVPGLFDFVVAVGSVSFDVFLEGNDLNQ